MIKINDDKFELKKISQVYYGLAQRVLDRFKAYKISENKKEVIVTKLENVLNYDEDDTKFKSNIKDFLMHSKLSTINEVIISFQTGRNKLNEDYFKILFRFFQYGSKSKIGQLFSRLYCDLDENLTDKIGIFEGRLECLFTEENKDLTFTKEFKDECYRVIENHADYKDILEYLKYNEEIEKVISYDLLSPEERHILINAMHVDVCPYCNRQYITNWKDKTGKYHATADLDHFYLKSLYPIASLCLYNFIPSCQICNSRFKLENDFFRNKHIYPYELQFGEDAKFEIDNIEAFVGGTPQIVIKPKTDRYKEEIGNSIDTFHLNEVYNTHIYYVKELVEKARMCNDTQIMEYILDLGGMFSTKEEILAFIFGNIIRSNEFDKIPLSKLTCDILESLKLI